MAEGLVRIHGTGKGLSNALGDLFHSNAVAPRCAEPQRRIGREPKRLQPAVVSMTKLHEVAAAATPWSRLEQALKVTDLLLHGGGSVDCDLPTS
jgi:recombination protein RecA